MSKRVPIPVTQIIAALERESGNTDTDPRWIAASALRKMEAWERRTLMCEISDKLSETWCPAAPQPIDAEGQEKQP